MFVIGEFFLTLRFFIDGLCMLLYWLLIARILVSWLPVDPYHSVVQFLFQVTEPILAPFRRLPLRLGMLDLSPLLAFFMLSFLNNVISRILTQLALQFRAM